jgi:hypothetical protein
MLMMRQINLFTHRAAMAACHRDIRLPGAPELKRSAPPRSAPKPVVRPVVSSRRIENAPGRHD